MDNSNRAPDFFIGWDSNIPSSVSSFTRRLVLVLLIATTGIGLITAAFQRTISSGKFEFGKVRDFSGILLKEPVPMLLADDDSEGKNLYYLVAVGKHGLEGEVAGQYHLRHVSLKGTFIGDNLEAMIEVARDSISVTGPALSNPLEKSEVVPTQITGEIVDSKCHLGVMNPGRFKPHRACAIQCISGGIPPILVARTEDGQLAHYLLVGEDGSAINTAVIDYIAEPVRVSGALQVIGNRRVLYVAPNSIERL